MNAKNFILNPSIKIKRQESQLEDSPSSNAQLNNSNLLISVIIPIFNEEKSIQEVIERIPNHRNYEIILIDDGSTDKSIEKVQEIQNKSIKVFRHEKNQGYGEALLTGFRHANGDLIITLDSDGQHNPEEIPSLIKALIDNNADIVIGSRYLGSYNYKVPLYTKIGEFFIKTLLAFLFRQKISNNQSGFRALKTKSLVLLQKMKHTKFGFGTELLFNAAYNNLKIIEVPVSMNSRKYGTSNIILPELIISISICILDYMFKKFKLDIKII
jgi:glycosyltransferase involved in cell wall biosynthesis